MSEFARQTRGVAALSGELDECDNILVRMNETLTGFRAHLGAVSGEIHNLQDESLDIGVRLLNRKRAETGVSRFLELVVVPPQLCSTLCVEDVTPERYVRALADLHRRLAYARRHSETQAVRDIAPVLAALRVQATAKLRVFFWSRFDSLRRPQTNMQIKQSVLIKYRRAFEFLVKNADDVALELKQVRVLIVILFFIFLLL